MLELTADLVLVGLGAPDAQAVIEALAARLHAGGLVDADYGRQTCAREREHPTGLPTQPFAIAFPHADADGVRRSALAVATLARPVVFQNMGDPEEQVTALRNLALLFSQPEKLLALQTQSTPPLAADWLRRELGLNEGAAAGQHTDWKEVTRPTQA